MLAFDLVDVPHRLLCAWGTNAADRLLLDSAPNNAGSRSGQIVVGSGDHAFSSLIRGLRGRCPTLVVSGVGRLATDLDEASQEVVYLTPDRVSTTGIRDVHSDAITDASCRRARLPASLS